MSTETTASKCANCGTELLGPHCYACGQPVKGMVRHFSSIVGDLFDTLLALDSRIVRTLGPLLLRPGFLSNEYLSGRRVRYVSPVRLFIFLCLIAFFAAQLSSDWSGIKLDEDDISRAETVEEVERIRDVVLADLAEARAESEGVAVAEFGLEQAESAVREKAEARIAALEGGTVEAGEGRTDCSLGILNGCLNADSDALYVDAFSPELNHWITSRVVRANRNAQLIKRDPNRVLVALLDVIPPTLFVMLPIFSLLLWVMYPLRRRLYMEHLIIGLHSHAFLSLSLLLIILLADIRAWLGMSSFFSSAIGWSIALLSVWMPLYLLLMQKRVYGQGWALTLFKFSVLGVSYLILLSIAMLFAILASLAGM